MHFAASKLGQPQTTYQHPRDHSGFFTTKWPPPSKEWQPNEPVCYALFPDLLRVTLISELDPTTGTLTFLDEETLGLKDFSSDEEAKAKSAAAPAPIRNKGDPIEIERPPWSETDKPSLALAKRMNKWIERSLGTLTLSRI